MVMSTAEMEYDFVCKVTMVGNSGAGKTPIVDRFVEGKLERNYQSSIDVEFKTKPFRVADYQGKLQIWNAPGQEKFKELTKHYYRGANVVMAVVGFKSGETEQTFTVRARAEFNGWLNEIGENTDNAMVFLVINGANLISPEDKDSIQSALLEYAQQNNVYQEIFFVSADTGEGVEALFTNACQVGLQHKGVKLPQDAEITFDKNTKQNRSAVSNLFGALWRGIWGLFSAVIGGVSIGIAELLIINPLSFIFQILSDSELEVWQKLILFLISPLATVVAVLIYTGWAAKEGWEGGLVGSFAWYGDQLQKTKANGNKSTNFNHVIASWIILGLTAAVVLAVIFPPAGLAVMLPTMAATFGLSGMSTAVLAVIAGVATAAILSAGYGLANLAFGGDAAEAKSANSAKASDDQEQSLPKGASTGAAVMLHPAEAHGLSVGGNTRSPLAQVAAPSAEAAGERSEPSAAVPMPALTKGSREQN